MANEHTSACVACGAIRKVTIGPDAIRHLLATFETPGWKLLLSIWEMEATLALQALVKERDPEEILQRQADVRQLYRRLQMERQYQAAAMEEASSPEEPEEGRRSGKIALKHLAEVLNGEE